MMLPVPSGKIQIEVTLSDETIKELFAAVALHKLMDEKRVWPQQVDQYVTSAREVAEAMMKARKEEAK
jgi:hypothetical protein